MASPVDPGQSNDSPPEERPKSLIPSMKNTTIVGHPEVSVWLGVGFPPRKWYPYNSVVRTLNKHMAIYRIGSVADFAYVEWDLSALENMEQPDRFWAAVNGDGSMKAYVRAHNNMINIPSRPVYAEATGGGPLGYYIGAISHDSRRLNGLFAQTYGHRNANPCRSCEQRYLREAVTLRPGPDQDPPLGLPSAVRRPGQESTLLHVMTPWFECISLPGFQRGACGCCLYHIEGSSCSYTLSNDREVATIQRMRGSQRLSEDLGDRRFGLQTCPRIVGEDSSWGHNLVRDLDLVQLQQQHNDMAAQEAERLRRVSPSGSGGDGQGSRAGSAVSQGSHQPGGSRGSRGQSSSGSEWKPSPSLRFSPSVGADPPSRSVSGALVRRSRGGDQLQPSGSTSQLPRSVSQGQLPPSGSRGQLRPSEGKPSRQGSQPTWDRP